MKFSVLQENMQNALTILSRAIATRTSLPVLSNILINATKQGVELQATNLEIAISQTIGAKVEKEGKLSVPARLFGELVSQLPPGKIQLSSNKDNLVIQTDSINSSLNGIAASEFPQIPKIAPKTTLKIPAKQLTGALSTVTVAASLDESRPVLAGVYMLFTKGALTLAATDSYRLAENKIGLDNRYEQGLIVPLRTAQEVQRSAGADDQEGEVELQIGETELAFSFDDTVITSQLIEGKYPDYTKIIPTSSKTKVQVNRQQLLSNVKLASIFAQGAAHTIQLNVSRDKLKLHTTAAHVGTNDATVDCKTTGNNLEISLNAKYLLDVIQTLNSDQVSLEFNTKLDPVLVRPTQKSNQLLHIIMPLRS
ncbi:DNA polymerase III subunit beta [Candidatus Saccharibacteria bacterium]|nr:DNA polymerase III subunit beta [Candidatus Saccharibacteria bacterium]